MRINKYLAECGIASRRGAEKFVVDGRVRVNGAVVRELTCVINDLDTVEFDGRTIKCQPKKVYIIMNKPAGVVTTCADQFKRKTVLDIINERAGGQNPRVFPVGRLDYSTEGLLLLTNDGDFAKQMTHPRHNVEKTYVATLDQPITRDQIEKLEDGIEITLDKLYREQTGKAKSYLVRGVIKQIKPTVVQITITTGLNRQIHRMFNAVGLRVTRLIRTRVGSFTLDGLSVGEWKYIENE